MLNYFRHWSLICLILGVLNLTQSGCQRHESTPKSMISQLAVDKEDEACRLSKIHSDRMPSEVSKFFGEAKNGQWDKATNTYALIEDKYFERITPTNGWERFMAARYPMLSSIGLTASNYWPNPHDPQWYAVECVNWTIYQFKTWDPELMQIYASNILDVIHSNGVFISGTPSGFFIIPAFLHWEHDSRGILIVSPNKLADDRYLSYLEEIYGRKMKVPTSTDMQQAFDAYVADATERLKAGQLAPGENFSTNGGFPTISGEVAVMRINSLMLKAFVSTNEDRELYYDEGYRMDWIEPYLVPNGPILKINHKPLPDLEQSVLDKDREFWQHLVKELTGLESVERMSLPQLSTFDEQVYRYNKLDKFAGNPHFATNDPAQIYFGKLRIAIARVYAWHACYAADLAEQTRMIAEADLAFRQSLALCPKLIELEDYGGFLYGLKRTNDLQTLAHSIHEFAPDGEADKYLTSVANYHP
jgi:hypothetical protein